ncbi:unnamed protein product [Dovyalis caffra]|uniref:Uncharacterized protein n=1 Tax=Dovyalis caffra TaxID=77055 RepID=A0AAV1RM59_9ROSI|nr:unnamed protein product [Dovyalis caffra]
MISPILQTDLHLGLVMGIVCRWHGIVRHDSIGHVILPGGKINPSLLNLKHLVHLDSSNNDFEGIHIPKFLGSPESLIYLNLSDARIWRYDSSSTRKPLKSSLS